MQHKLLNALKSLVLALPLMAASAQAQTVAAGPYYATPAWDQTLACTALNSCPRFIVLSNMNSRAVLDRETGLVWARDAIDVGGDLSGSWSQAVQNCDHAHLATGRRGWRLPTAAELTSLLVVSPAPALLVGLPAGHPFVVPATLQQSSYWTASEDTLTANPDRAKFVNIVSGGVGVASKDSALQVWCVRGGQ